MFVKKQQILPLLIIYNDIIYIDKVGDKMARKKKVIKKARKQTFRFLIFGGACLFIIGGILTSLTKVWVEIYEKYKEKQELEDKILVLKEEEAQLTVDVERLQDPEYVARYLREKYFYSKNGEYVIRIPEESKK